MKNVWKYINLLIQKLYLYYFTIFCKEEGNKEMVYYSDNG